MNLFTIFLDTQFFLDPYLFPDGSQDLQAVVMPAKKRRVVNYSGYHQISNL